MDQELQPCKKLRLQSQNSVQKDKLPWQRSQFERKWEKKSAQTVTSHDYKQLKKYIHMPYRKLDHLGINTYYFPVYATFKVKNITQFDFQSLQVKVNGVLIINLCVDYIDYFSPTLDNSDEKRVRQAIEKLFNFEYIKKQGEQKGSDKQGKNEKNNFQNKRQDIIQRNFLYLRFNRDDPIRLPCKRIFEGQIKQDEKPKKKDQSKNNQKQKKTDKKKSKQPVQYITWTIRKQFKLALSPGTFWQDLIAPFNLLKFKLVLCFQDINIKLSNNEHVKFKFNCMKRVGDESLQQKKNIFQQLRFTDDGSLGQYDLAQTELDVSCDKYLVNDYEEDIQTDYQSFKYITFTIPFYKYPIIDSLTIFIPLILITVLTLFTFVQGPDFNDKIGNLATLMIVYVGLMPAINDALPSSTSIVLIDIVVYCQLTVNILCLIRGQYIMDYNTIDFQKYSVWSDVLFIISFCIAILTFIALLFLLIYFKVNEAYFYNLEQDNLEQIDNKVTQWVSPHMYNCARNIMTQIARKSNEKQKQKNKQNKQEKAHSSVKFNSNETKTKLQKEQDRPK